MDLRDLAQADASSSIFEEGMTIDFEWSTTDPSAFQTRSAHAGLHSFDDKRALEFGNDTDDRDDGTAQGSASIEVLAEADELDL